MLKKRRADGRFDVQKRSESQQKHNNTERTFGTLTPDNALFGTAATINNTDRTKQPPSESKPIKPPGINNLDNSMRQSGLIK